MSSLVTIRLNALSVQLPAASTVADLLAQQGIGEQAVATALNAEFVPRQQRATQPLSEGDVVTTFAPIVGG